MSTDAAFRSANPTAEADWLSVLRSVREGKAESLGSLLEEFRPYLLTIAADEMPRRLGPKLGRSDIVQEAIVKGYQSFATFAGNSREELAGWLRKILLNHLANTVDAYHTEKRDITREQPADSRIVAPGEPTPSHLVLNAEERDRLEQALARLPEESQKVLLLRHRDNFSFAELAQAFSLSETGARKLWTRAVRALRLELKGLETVRS